jgi:hypothetical protein
MWSYTRTAIAMLSLLLTAGCLDLRVRAGTRPDESQLEQRLVMGKSTTDDVRNVLGEPFGRGASMLPMQDAPRTMWTYYYEEGTLKDDRRIFLFVYFSADNRYEGYMWFSSLPRLNASTAPSGPGADANR